MRRPGRPGFRLLIAAAFALGGAASGAPSAVAAQPTVGAPTAVVQFLDAITFSGTATLTADVTRVEVVVDLEGATRSIVAELAVPLGSRNVQLGYVLDAPGGFILPNTDVVARFRLIRQDGSALAGPPVTVKYEDTRYTWKALTGEFVTVHWTEGGKAFGRRAGQIADDAVRKIGDLLGVTEKEPIDFYIYADRTAFYDILGPGTRENVGGEAFTEIRTLFANIAGTAVDDPWVGVVIPHELAHLVFDTVVSNPYHYPPSWLNEGIAVYLSEGFGAGDRRDVREAAAAGTIMPLAALGAAFPTTRDRFYLAYSESVSAVSFLVDTYGRDALVELVRSFGEGLSDDEAMRAALGTDLAHFDAAWLDSIGASAPSPFGPQPAPAGPLPDDWAGAAPTAGTVQGAEPSSTAARPSTAPGEPSPLPPSNGGGVALIALVAGLVAIAGAALWLRRRPSSRMAATVPSTMVPGDEPGAPLEPPAVPDVSPTDEQGQ